MKNEKALFALSYGLFVLTARQGEKDNGCIINTVMQVTDIPHRMVITVNKDSLTHDMILATGRFTLSILSEEADFSLIRRFGFHTGRNTDKFTDFPETKRGENGVLLITQGTCAWLSGKVISTQNLGTHTLFLADVEDGDLLSPTPAMTYAYYHAHVKPKPQASVQQPDGKRRWVCRVCGYIYEGEALPEDFICPICKHPAEDFEELK